MDLSGTARLHGMVARQVARRLRRRGRKATSASRCRSGSSCNKFLAKIASDLDKPRGFAVLGGGEAAAFLAPRPVTLIFGVGKMAQQRLARDGLRTIGDLQRAGEESLVRRYGAEGARLYRLAHGLDDRPQSLARARRQEHLGGNHLRPRHRRLPPARAAALAAVREGVGPPQAQRARRRDGDAQAQDRRFPHPHARAIAQPSDPARRAHFWRRARTARARNRRHALSPDRNRSFRADARRRRRPRRSARPAHRRSRSARSTGCANDSATKPWSRGSRSTTAKTTTDRNAHGQGLLSLISSVVSSPAMAKSL